MQYSYEYKRRCAESYRRGDWSESPDGIKLPKDFHNMVRRWARMEEANGPEALNHKGSDKEWSPEEKRELVSRVLAGASNQSVAIEAGVSICLLYKLVHNYEESGYNGLVNRRKGGPQKDPDMKKVTDNDPRKLEKSEYEELVRLRAENEYIKTEIEVLKKEIAFREKRWDEQLKAKKRKSSVNSGNKDIR